MDSTLHSEGMTIMTERRITGNAYSLNEAEVAERNKHIWKLRLAHKTQAEIAEEVGLSQPQISRILDEMAKSHSSEELDTYFSMQISRLENVATTLLDIATRQHIAHNNGRVVRHPDTNELVTDDGPAMAAYGKYLDVMKEINKLRGLHAPEKKEVTGKMDVSPEVLNLIRDVTESDNVSED
jgi:DNA-binding Lrp family transcriptional regulator